MALSTKNTVMAVMKEVTEGTPVVPTSGTDYIALQEGFSITPSFTTLENAELTGSIGMAKSVLGFEQPTASLSHYLRHSGVEGQAPNFNNLLEACIGTVSSNATERTTAAASTVSLVKLAAGGSDFSKGKALLIKDPVNGYSIRNVLSVATNDITLAQNLSVAPAIGVNTGKCVSYSVANSGHPTLTVWAYLANSGALEMMSGTRVIDMNINITAGEQINTDFSLEGISFFYDPMTVVATNKYLDFDDGAVQVAILSEGTYKDPYELAAAIQTAMDGASSDTITCSYSDSTGKFTITSDGASLDLLWNTGANTANGIHTLIGFSAAADDTGALTYTSGTAQSWVSPYTPSYDSASPLVAKNNTLMIGDSTEIDCFGGSAITVTLTNTKTNQNDICSYSGISGSQFTSREVSATVSVYLNAGQAKEFRRYRQNETISFAYNFGEKVGGNWVAGKSGNIYLPNATISEFALNDDGGLVKMDLTLKAFVANAESEFFLNFL